MYSRLQVAMAGLASRLACSPRCSGFSLSTRLKTVRDGISKMLPKRIIVYSVSLHAQTSASFGDKAATIARPPETTGLTQAEIRRIVLDILG
jgi:hypothetical protein